MRYLRDIAVVFLILVIVASIAVWCLSTEAQATGPVTGNEYTIVFRLKPQASEGIKPEVRVYVVANGTTEGEAIITGYKYLAEKFTVQATEQLQYLEVQGREKK